jgi:hypothetical protein
MNNNVSRFTDLSAETNLSLALAERHLRTGKSPAFHSSGHFGGF